MSTRTVLLGAAVIAFTFDAGIRIIIAHDVLRSNAAVVRSCEVTQAELDQLNRRIIATERTSL